MSDKEWNDRMRANHQLLANIDAQIRAKYLNFPNLSPLLRLAISVYGIEPEKEEKRDDGSKDSGSGAGNV